MAIDRLAVPVLHPVNQGRFNPFATIGEHRIGRDHVEQCGFFGSQSIGQELTHIVVDTKAFRIGRDHIHPDLLRQPDRHQVSRPFDAGAQRGWAIELVAGVLWAPDPLGCVDFNRGVNDDRRGRVPTVQRGSIDKRFERRTGLSPGLCRAVENRMLIGEPALHGDHPAGVDIHRHEPAFDLGDLPQCPADKGPRLVVGHPAHMHHVAQFEIRSEIAFDPRNIFARYTEFFGVGFLNAFDPDAHGFVADFQNHGGEPRRFKHDIAGHIGLGQGLAPFRFAVQFFDGNGFPGAAPLADTPVILFKLKTQGARCFHLHFRINRGAHGKTTGQEFAFAEIAA